MALPPTKLTELLGTCRDAEEMFQKLRVAGCLTEATQKNPETVHAAVATAQQEMTEMQGGEGWSGPTTIDLIASRLVTEGLLNDKGKDWALFDAR